MGWPPSRTTSSTPSTPCQCCRACCLCQRWIRQLNNNEYHQLFERPGASTDALFRSYMGWPISHCKSASKLQVTKQPNNLMKSPLHTFHRGFPSGQPARYPFLDFKNDPELAGVILFVSVLLLPRLVLINCTLYLPYELSI